MNVAIVCPYSMSEPGGVQEHVRGLAAGLGARDCDVFLFGPDMPRDLKIDGVVPISLGGAVRIPANGSIAPLGLDPRMIVRLELGLDPADVIHVHEPFLPACLSAILRAPSRTALVGTFHAAADRSVPYAIASPLLRRIARRLHASCAVSPSAAALAHRYSGVHPQIVSNGIDTDSFAGAAPDPWAQQLGTTVLFTSRPEPRKGFDLAVRAFADATRGMDDVHLVCIPARGSDLGPLDADARARVHCLGPVSHERKLGLYAAASVHLAPSLGRESFGIIVVEAMASGCAVLASDIPGYRHAGGDAPVYLPPGEVDAWTSALRDLLADHERRHHLGARGAERARIFDWDSITDRTLGIYRAALDRL